MKQSRFIVTLLLAMPMTLIIANGIASAKPSDDPQPGRKPVIVPTPNADSAVQPLTYAWVITANVPVYANPGDFVPVRNLGAGFLYVSVMGKPIVQDGQTWYQINPGEYINAANIRLVRPSPRRSWRRWAGASPSRASRRPKEMARPLRCGSSRPIENK